MPEHNRPKFIFILALVVAICAFLPQLSFAVEMSGKVVEVQDNKITVRLNDAWVPNEGDRITFSREHEALGTISVGEGQVVDIQRAPVLIVKKTKGEGEITVGTDAIVFSQSTKRVAEKKETIRHPDPINSEMDKALLKAVEDNRLDAVTDALRKGANVNAAPENARTPLMIASENGNIQLVQALLDSGADPNIESRKWGRTALKLAARKGHIDIVDLLLDKGVPIDYRGNNNEKIYLNGASALSYAAAEGQGGMITHLIARGANPNLESFKGITPLFYAASEGKIDAVNALLNAGVLLDQVSSSGLTPLMAAAQADGHWELAAYLLGAGADPNRQIQKVGKGVRPEVLGMTALMISIFVGDKELFFTILLSGADPTIKRADGKTALDLATNRLKEIKPDSNDYEKMEMIQRSLLHPDWGKKKAMEVIANELEDEIEDNNLIIVSAGLRLGVDPNFLVRGDPLFFEAIKNNNMAMVELMLEHGADPNVKNDQGGTAFYKSLYREMFDVARLLMAKGADPKIFPPDPDGTPLHVFAKEGIVEGLRILLAAGLNPNIQDKDQETPLHMAAKEGHLEAFQILLAAGADPKIKNEDGEHAIDRARNSKRAQFQTLLRNAGHR